MLVDMESSQSPPSIERIISQTSPIASAKNSRRDPEGGENRKI